jgi:hypothetical protein
LLTKRLDAVIEPTTLTLPEEKIEPVNIKVSAFIEKLSPVFALMFVEPVTVNPPDILVDPVIFRTPLT